MKPFKIDKNAFITAFKMVKENRGTYGVDKQSIEDFEKNLKSNLYKIWNRMSSGSYFPPAIRAVEIPKKDGGVRLLGIPTVADRIAQAVARNYLEEIVDPLFHEDSYGYRKGKDAHQALAKARERCWKSDWVLDLDIKGFFDNINHDLIMKAVKFHTSEKWIHLYVERWLKSPIEDKEGNLKVRNKGTPQGGVISPLLANLFLHYGFDVWMKNHFPTLRFERYADDAVVHCKSLKQASYLKYRLELRMLDIGLELHPKKTKIVYCKDGKRRGKYECISFDFLGYTFRSRAMRIKSKEVFHSFNPAMSKVSLKEISGKINKLNIQRCTPLNLEEIGKIINPKLRGWINYYGKFYKTELFKIWRLIQRKLLKWFMSKYKNYRGHIRRAAKVLYKVSSSNPKLLAHWELIYAGPVLNGNMGSCMN